MLDKLIKALQDESFFREIEERTEEADATGGNSSYVSACDNALTKRGVSLFLLRKGADAEQWIPCSERRPDNHRNVLVRFDTHTIGDAYSVAYFMSMGTGGQWVINSVNFRRGFEVTHWRELPPRPDIMEDKK